MKRVIKHNGKELCKAIYCGNVISRFLGLMLRKKAAAIIELPRESRTLAAIHTYLMRFPIDVSWLDRKKIVVDTRKHVKPFRHLVVPKKKAKYIIETPSGEVKIKIGYRLEFKR